MPQCSRLPTLPSSAGEQLPAISSNTVCINRQYLGDDFDWETLGPRRTRTRIRDVNNFELTEWFIGHGITLHFDKSLYFRHATIPGSCSFLSCYVRDTTSHHPSKAKVQIHRADGTKESVNVFIVHERRKDVISHAVEQTFPNAVTLDDLCKSTLCFPPGSDPAIFGKEPDDSDDDDIASSAHTEGPTSNSSTSTLTNGPPAKKARNRTPMLSYPGKNVAAICIDALLDTFNITTPGTELRHKRRQVKKLSMRNDTPGASFVALSATMHVCLMAADP
jgi:hypothetical protein